MGKKGIFLLLCLMLVLLLPACQEEAGPTTQGIGYCEHIWQEANCFHPKTCRRCGLKEGEAVAHNWQEATCLAPRMCSLCRLVEGEPIPHNYVEHFCDSCGLMLPSENLEFTMNYDGQSYSLTGLGSCTDTVIYVPASYLGLPVTRVAAEAFSHNRSVTDIYLSATISQVDWMQGLHNIYVVEENPHFAHLDGVLFSKDFVDLIQYPNGRVGAYTVPETVRYIASFAFQGCSGLTEINLGETLLYIGDSAFNGCAGLRELRLPGSLTIVSSYAFAQCFYLETVYFAEGTNEPPPSWSDSVATNNLFIHEMAFINCSSLREVTLPQHLVQLGKGTFFGCTALADIAIPANVGKIPEQCFYDCSILETVTLQDGLQAIGPRAFGSCVALKEIIIPTTVSKIQEKAFEDCTGLEAVTLPSCLDEIGDYAFHGCTALRKIALPEGLRFIQVGAFYGCAALTEVNLPESLQRIGSHAFYGADLQQVSIPSGLRELGQSAFGGNDSLTYQPYDNGLYLGNGDNPHMVLVKAVDTNITDCKIHTDATMIASGAFAHCKQLTAIQIPANIMVINASAFWDCPELTQVEFAVPASALYLGGFCFDGCFKLESVQFAGTINQWVMYVSRDVEWTFGSNIKQVNASDGWTKA